MNQLLPNIPEPSFLLKQRRPKDLNFNYDFQSLFENYQL